MSEHRGLLSSCLLRHARGLRALAFLALTATACGSESSTGDPGGGGAAGGSGGSGAGQTTGQGGSGGQATTTGEGGEQTTTGQGGGGGMPQPKTLNCFFQCGSVTDCYSAGAPPTVDADNWTCENSFCVYKGCNSTQECVDTYGESANLTCKPYPGSTLTTCQPDCSSVSDCVSANAPPAVDADNYACENGFCIYKGCNSTQECIDTYGQSANLTCKAYPGSTTKSCLPDCSSVSDCVSANAQPHVDADNYACENGFCIYKGCNSTTECVDAYGSDFICSEGP